MKEARKTTSRAAAKSPSKASLREMPERSAHAKTKPNKFAAEITKAGGLTYQVDGEQPYWVSLPRGTRAESEA